VAQWLTVRHGRAFLQHVVPAVVKPARTLWNELIGFLFLCLGIVFGIKTGTYIRDFMSTPPGAATGDLIRMTMAGFCTLVMLWYGFSSFRRARKISRS
jgi:hypothetical protein